MHGERENVFIIVFASILIFLWVMDGLTYTRPSTISTNAYTDTRTSDVRIRDYRTGVSRVDAKLSDRRGYKRRILPYERVTEILVPEISDDSRVCDDFDELDPAQRKLVTCSLSDGETACFKCIESRRYKRACIHLTSDVTIYRDGEPIVLPKNTSDDEGYCLPTNFEQLAPPTDKRTCNAYTGTWILARLQTPDSNSYNWVCSCRYPQLMTNLTTVMSDCLRDVGCGAHGHLDDKSAAGQQDPYVNGSCVCEAGYAPSFTDGVGPVCITASLRDNESASASMINSIVGEQTFGYIKSNDPLIDTKFSRYFTDNPILVPNPCYIDSITGEQLADSPYVLRMIDVPQSDKWHDSNDPSSGDVVSAAMCVPNDESLKSDPLIGLFSEYIGTISQSDYLANNGGRWCNGVTRITNRDYPYNGSNVDRVNYSLFTYQFDAHADSDLPDAGVLLNKNYFKWMDQVRAVQATSPFLTKAYSKLRAPYVQASVQPFTDDNPEKYNSTTYCAIYDPHIIGNPTARLTFVCTLYIHNDLYRLFWLDYNGIYYGLHQYNANIYLRTWITDFRKYLGLINGGYLLDSWQTGGVYANFYVDTDNDPQPNPRVSNAKYIEYLACIGQGLKALPFEVPGCRPNVPQMPGESIDRATYLKTVKFISPVVTVGRLRTVNCNNWGYDGSVQVMPISLRPTINDGQLYVFLNGGLFNTGDATFPRDSRTCYQTDLVIPGQQ